MDGLRSRPSKATIATAPPADADDLLRLGDTHVDNASSIEIQIGPAGHSHGDDGSAFNTAHESLIDSGFDRPGEFYRGVVDLRAGREIDLDELGTRQAISMAEWIVLVLMCCSVICIPYVMCCVKFVRRGDVVLVQSFGGRVRILKAGWNAVRFSEVISFGDKSAKVTDSVIKCGATSILRVFPGEIGLGLLCSEPIVLLPGRHLIDDPAFEFKGCVSMGIHRINAPRFAFNGFRSSTDEAISHGSKHRIVVPSGKIGLGWDNGTPRILETGRTHNIDSSVFKYDGSQFVTNAVIKHGSITIVTVKQGQAGISYDGGALVVLPTGRHVMPVATQLFAGFLSLGQQVLNISEVVSMTSDNVGISFDAAISIQVVDPCKAVTMLCPVQDDSSRPFKIADMHTTIVEKAKLGLTIIIGNNRLNATFKATQRIRRGGSRAPFTSDALLDAQSELLPPRKAGAPMAASPQDEAEDPDADTSASHDSFKQHVHDIFMHSFSEQMLHDCGVLVHEMSIEDVTITNAELARAMAQGAVARTGLIKAQIDQEISRTLALAEQTAEVLRAQGHAQAVGILAAADADRITKLDEAMSRVCVTTQQRELVRASGEVLRDCRSSVLLAHSAVDVASLLSGPMVGGQLLGLGAGSAPSHS